MVHERIPHLDRQTYERTARHRIPKHRSGNTAYINIAIRKSGVDRSVHKLRHTFATKLLKEGLSLNDVRLLLGHASIQTTQRYQHLEASDISPKAVAILNRQNTERNRTRIKVA